MAIDTTNSLYDTFSSRWQRARDVISGGDTIKGKGVTYLPKLLDQTDEEYTAYIQRSIFFNATSRTADGLHGSIFRKDPTVNLAEASRALLGDADLNGRTITDYSMMVVDEVLSVARGGTLVDYSTDEGRPFAVFYATEDILDWRTSRNDGVMELQMVKVREVVEEVASPDDNREAKGRTSSQGDGDDEFDVKEIERFRIFKLIDAGNGKIYVSEVWRKINDEGGSERKFILEDIQVPVKNGKPLTFIPFYFHGPRENSTNPEKLPLDDLIQVNLDHYRLNADYKHGLHFAAMPTAWVAGFPKDTILKIGSSVAWVTENTDAKAGFLEFTGQGLNPLKEALDKDEKLMAVLGARLLEEQKKEAETSETLKIRQSGESSVLSMISKSCSISLTRVLRAMIWWATPSFTLPKDVKEEDASIELNRDFISAKLAAQEVVQLVQAWQQRGISQQTLLWNLQQGEIIPPGRTIEEEADFIDEEVSTFLPGLPDSKAKDE